MDVQEALKLLQFRLGNEVSFRPLGVRGGVLVYRVDGRVLSERDILGWVASLTGPRRNGELAPARVSPRGVRVSFTRS